MTAELWEAVTFKGETKKRKVEGGRNKPESNRNGSRREYQQVSNAAQHYQVYVEFGKEEITRDIH